MKRWHLLRSLFLAVVGTLLLNNSKGMSGSPCHLADSWRNAKQYDLAWAKYTDLLKKEQQESCSKERQGNYELALQHLEYAFELRNQTLLSWAQKDPSLIGLRNDSNVKDSFQKLLEKYSSNS